jgi:hypothetical protein
MQNAALQDSDVAECDRETCPTRAPAHILVFETCKISFEKELKRGWPCNIIGNTQLFLSCSWRLQG